MDPETLVTFLFRAPPHIRTVELLGSWDNFTQPYIMHHDRRRGIGTWTGCFKFHNIIFDGNRPDWSRPRTGGLKQGGVYWYYYRFDNDVEAYDDSRVCTADCPLMPGQTMNVIEVPTEVMQPPSRCRSACYEGIAGTLSALKKLGRQTLDPADKFAAIEPPPVSRVHGRCISDLALGGRLESRPPSFTRSVLPSPVMEAPKDHNSVPGAVRSPERRCSGDRKSSYYSQPSGDGSRLVSVVDGYAAESPIEAPHPNPLASAPVEQETRDMILSGFEQFDFGISSGSRADDHSAQQGADDGEDGFEIQSVYSCASDNYDAFPSPPCGLSNRQNDLLHAQAYPGNTPAPPRHSTPQITLKDVLIPAAQQRRARSHSAGETGRRDKASSPTNSNASATEPAINPKDPQDVRDVLLRDAPCSDDIWSPTFSAATISSGGLMTPFRLSVAYSRDTTAHDAHDGTTLDDVAERLKRLSTKAPSPQIPADTLPSTSFDGYALPATTFDAEKRLEKVATTSRDADGFARLSSDLVLPTLDLAAVPTNSMADDIFSELGYLGGSIA
jgi:hypothetical protein